MTIAILIFHMFIQTLSEANMLVDLCKVPCKQRRKKGKETNKGHEEYRLLGCDAVWDL
jgi:hypothetical protein